LVLVKVFSEADTFLTLLTTDCKAIMNLILPKLV